MRAHSATGKPAAPVPGLPAQPIETAGFAWAPDATHFAVVAGHDGSPGGPGPLSQLEVIPVGGGSPVTWYESTQDGIDLDGWWPDGQGLLFWLDTVYSASIAADGLTLYSQASGTAPRPLATTLVSSSSVSWSAARGDDGETGGAAGAVVAVVAGGDRVVWGGDKRVETCDPVTATCSSVAGPEGAVSLSPAWGPGRQLYFVAASDTGPFSPVGDAVFSDGWLGRWDETARLYVATAQGAVPVPGTGNGVVDAVDGGNAGLVVVRDDALWLVASGRGAARVAGPLFASASPGGYYGQVDWPSMFAWSRPAST